MHVIKNSQGGEWPLSPLSLRAPSLSSVYRFENDSLNFLQWYYTQLQAISFDTPSKIQPVEWRLCAQCVPPKYLISMILYCERISIDFRVMRCLLSVCLLFIQYYTL